MSADGERPQPRTGVGERVAELVVLLVALVLGAVVCLALAGVAMELFGMTQQAAGWLFLAAWFLPVPLWVRFERRLRREDGEVGTVGVGTWIRDVCLGGPLWFGFRLLALVQYV